MVAASSSKRVLNATSLADLSGATICVLAGTTNEQVLTDTFNAQNIAFTPLTFPEANALYSALNDGRCDAATSDKSQLAGQRVAQLTNPDDWVIMEETLSKEPLGPAVLQNDAQWADVIRWVVYATWYAEELGVTSSNVDDRLANGDSNTKRFLGGTGSLGTDMGIPNDAFYRVIKLVGNYGEIYDKTLGPNTKFNVPPRLECPIYGGWLAVFAAIPLDLDRIRTPPQIRFAEACPYHGSFLPPPSQSAVPFYRNIRVLRILAQIAFIAFVLLVGWFLWDNMVRGLQRIGGTFSFAFLNNAASFALSEAPLPYDPASDTYLYAFFVGILNTLRVIVVGIVLTSLLGLVAGIARLSSNWLIAKIAQVYVEIFRNTPLLIQLFFW